MNAEHKESGEGDWPDDPGSGYKTLDELSREDILRALAGLDERLRTDADDAFSLLARGMLHSKPGDDRRAAQDFTRVIELEPGDPVPYYNRGCTYAEMGDPSRALAEFHQAIALDPGNPHPTPLPWYGPSRTGRAQPGRQRL